MTLTRIGHDSRAVVVDSAADDAASSFDDLAQLITDLEATWSALPSAYSASEADTVFVALAPLSPRVEMLRGDLRAVVRALRDYADRLAALGVRQRRIDEDRQVVRDDDLPGTVSSSDLDIAEMLLGVEAGRRTPSALSRCGRSAVAVVCSWRTGWASLQAPPAELPSGSGSGPRCCTGFGVRCSGPSMCPPAGYAGHRSESSSTRTPMLLTQSGVLIGEKNLLMQQLRPRPQPRHRAGPAHPAEATRLTATWPNVIMEPPGLDGGAAAQ